MTTDEFARRAEDQAKIAMLKQSLADIESIARNAANRHGLWVHNEALAKIVSIAEELNCTTSSSHLDKS
jgi:hypothetical protein